MFLCIFCTIILEISIFFDYISMVPIIEAEIIGTMNFYYSNQFTIKNIVKNSRRNINVPVMH